ncbi:hypothetical protein N780_00890 [Pontibacillus chungwhensis BH030062]|uniref:Uncharacterized protein n=1 Tax=Pontibacillus chungwhensis BH030062 TaxID=1385513 RepID=A0A0A2UVT0_9BACI|nr:hypothetical protein N780_00890 [Pontibacillus chungwhensis BH030062]
MVAVKPHLLDVARYRLFPFGKGGPGNYETPAGERARRDPAESVANEEARQLARGKRMISRTSLRSIKVDWSVSLFTAKRHHLEFKSPIKGSLYERNKKPV